MSRCQPVRPTAGAAGALRRHGRGGRCETKRESTRASRPADAAHPCRARGRPRTLVLVARGHLSYYLVALSSIVRRRYLLGYLAKENRAYLIDKTLAVVSFKVLLSVLQYQTAVVRGDFDAANAILPSIPPSEHGAVARFLESQGFKEEALAVTTDEDQKFELALELNKIEICIELLDAKVGGDDADSTDTQAKWKKLGDLALAQVGRVGLCWLGLRWGR